ncbi:Hexosyltransferase [Trichostrongylus colubriformis]|uniref:Hexosyltransferase n=1 Tax=Trichostrongylus colubriformis TaxID=6319 RepID=A0AAN8F269_TRICO
MMFNSRVIRTKPLHAFCVIVTCTVILGLISNELMFKEKVIEERPPNRTLYYSLLFRDVHSLNFTSPTIHNESDVIVIVCTRPGDITIRNAIRRTWANPLLSESVQNRSVSIVFLIVHTSLVTVQIFAAYRLIAANYPDKYVLKVDSDVVLLLDKINAHLEEPEERSIMCYVHQSAYPVRETGSKWYIPESSYPEEYLPDYCSGPTYLMTPAALTALMEVVWEAKVFEVEDAFFTGVLARLAGVRIRKQRGFWDRLVCFIYIYLISQLKNESAMRSCTSLKFSPFT